MKRFELMFYRTCMLSVATGITSFTLKTTRLVSPAFFTLNIKTFDFKSCMLSCATNAVCGGFLFDSTQQICTAHHIGFYIDEERKKNLFRFCRKRGCPDHAGYSKLRSGQCVRVVQDMLKWEDSRRACFSQGADLVVIDTLEKTRMLKRYLASFRLKPALCGQRIWLGLRRYRGRTYEWVGRGEKNPWVDWSPGDPSYGREHCGQYSYGRIGDVRCGNPRFYICEIADED